MTGRRDDGRGQRSGDRELRRGQQQDYQAGRHADDGRDRPRDWDEHGYERGPERMGLAGRDARGTDEERDYEHPSRDFDRDRDFRSMEGDRDRRDYEMDRDFGRAARELDRAREPGRDFNRDREMDRRAREFDPERIARRPEYSPSGNYRAFQDELREERERPRRYGGRESGGHGPGVENMAPPRVGYGTSPSRRDDHELGHGGFLGGTYRSATPSRRDVPTRPSSPGRGPRSYQRGDDRIRADLCDKLMQGWMDASDVDVKVKDGEVTLSGTVRSRDEKRAIEDAAEEVLGVKDVTNNIRINRAEGVMHHQASEEPVQQPGADAGDDRGLHS